MVEITTQPLVTSTLATDAVLILRTASDGTVALDRLSISALLVGGISPLEISPVGDFSLSFAAIGDSSYIIHPPAGKDITLSVTPSSANAGKRQTMFVEIIPLATSGTVTLSATGVRYAEDINGNELPPAVSSTAGDITSIRFISIGDTAVTILGR